ncbi:helix-turn-helix transcriptional regulator [Roseobacteraceae bacterium S113]
MAAVIVLQMPMARSTRLFEILQHLRRANRPVTAQELAEQLEVAKRTIYRDMAALQAMRLPIEGEAGLGYVLRGGYDLPPLMFDAEEVEAVMLGLALLGRTADPALERAAGRAAAKIADVVPDDMARAAPLKVSQWNAIPASRVELRQLRIWIREARILEITYTDEAGARSVRAVKPLAILYYVDAVLLAGWCMLRDDFRHFRVDRIESCTPLEGHFEPEFDALFARWQAQSDLA